MLDETKMIMNIVINRKNLDLMRNILAFLVVSSVTLLLWDVLAVLLVAGEIYR